MSIRVLLADGHPIIRAGLRSAIERNGRDIVVVREVSDGREALASAGKRDADVYVLGSDMPGLDGLETARQLRRKDPRARIVIFSLQSARTHVDRAFRAGVRGYIHKESACGEVVRAIEEVHRGGYFLSPAISRFILDAAPGKAADRAPRPAGGRGLTPREREILQLISEGLSSREIGRRLNLYLNTIKVHRRNLMSKLAIHKQADLVRYAIKEGIAKL